MITNWDLVSHIDTKTGNQRFSLLIDGTENDARLIAKKLAGFVKDPVPADAPFVYSFGLPDNLDETTQDKIRTATREGVELTNKVNQFVPGGVLGDPLFNGNYQKDGKDFPTFLMEQGTQAALNTQKSTAAQAIGHKELFPYFRGEKSLDECIEHLKMQTRRYAKRQMTWFTKMPQIQWIYMDEEENPLTAACQRIKDFLGYEK